MTLCSLEVRGGGTCLLDEGHKGYHSVVTFECDECLKHYRGQPHNKYLDEEGCCIAQFCFLCTLKLQKEYLKAMYEG